LGGATYGYFIMKETFNIPDREKKLLYTPKKYIDDLNRN